MSSGEIEPNAIADRLGPKTLAEPDRRGHDHDRQQDQDDAAAEQERGERERPGGGHGEGDPQWLDQHRARFTAPGWSMLPGSAARPGSEDLQSLERGLDQRHLLAVPGEVAVRSAGWASSKCRLA